MVISFIANKIFRQAFCIGKSKNQNACLKSFYKAKNFRQAF